MSVLHINNITNKEGTGGPTIAGITTVDSSGFMRVPVGDTRTRLVNDYENIVTDGLVLHLDAGRAESFGGDGTTWRDLSGNNNNGTLVNGVGFSAEDGGSLEFDGVDDYIDVGDLGINMSQFTVEVWFKPNVVENYRNVIDCNYGTPDPADGIVKSGNIGPRLEMNSAGTLGWIWGASRSANDPFFSATVVSSGLAANTWHHTAIVVSGNQATNGSSYYNGSLASANGVQISGGSTAWYGEFQNVNIGRGFVLSSRFFDGQIGEVRVYPRALTPSEVLQNYNALKGRYI